MPTMNHYLASKTNDVDSWMLFETHEIAENAFRTVANEEPFQIQKIEVSYESSAVRYWRQIKKVLREDELAKALAIRGSLATVILLITSFVVYFLNIQMWNSLVIATISATVIWFLAWVGLILSGAYYTMEGRESNIRRNYQNFHLKMSHPK